MNKLSFKYKILSLGGVWLVMLLILFGWLFSWLQGFNTDHAIDVLAKRKEYAELQAEQKSYIQGKADLDNLAKKDIQPSSFFSKDTSLVGEIQTLEKLASDSGLKIVLGIAGTSKVAEKANSKSDLLIIPYTLQLTGSYDGAFAFVSGLENLPFITHVKHLQITTTGKDTVSLTMGSVFYIQK